MGHEVMTLLRQMWSMNASTTKWNDFFSLWSGVKLGGKCCNTICKSKLLQTREEEIREWITNVLETLIMFFIPRLTTTIFFKNCPRTFTSEPFRWFNKFCKETLKHFLSVIARFLFFCFWSFILLFFFSLFLDFILISDCVFHKTIILLGLAVYIKWI